MILVDEWCPNCENEVKINGHKPSNCPECGKLILPCSMCVEEDMDCGVNTGDGLCNRFRTWREGELK